MNDRPIIRLSYRWLLLALGLLLIGLGWLASPRDAQGRPLLHLPDVKANENDHSRVYLRKTSLADFIRQRRLKHFQNLLRTVLQPITQPQQIETCLQDVYGITLGHRLILVFYR